jgi:hypothetical protein
LDILDVHDLFWYKETASVSVESFRNKQSVHIQRWSLTSKVVRNTCEPSVVCGGVDEEQWLVNIRKLQRYCECSFR